MFILQRLKSLKGPVVNERVVVVNPFGIHLLKKIILFIWRKLQVVSTPP